MRSSIITDSHGRQIGRLLAEITLSAMVDTRRRLAKHSGGAFSIDDIVLLLVLLRNHPLVRPWTTSPNDTRPGPSINGLAESLRRPFETTRRHIHSLADAGLLLISSEGVRLSRVFDCGPLLDSLLAGMHDGALRFLEDLDDCGLDEPVLHDGSPYQPHGVSALGIELCLIPFEIAQPSLSNWTEMAIVQAIAAGGIRPVTEDPELSLRFASETTPPPVELRTPVQPSAISRALDIPISTVHRHVLAAGRDGKLERVRGGVVVTRQLLESASFQGARAELVHHTLLALSRFRMLGFDYSNPRARYIGKRPDRITLGD